ncbi:MAG: glucose-1-phosphate adenylyltransferase subunit GlgD [Culicoidibacterales bacterium]
MFNDILGIISAPERHIRLGTLTDTRPFATVGLASKYRIVDFSLSNLSLAGIDDVVYCTENPSTSLLRHLKSGKPWDMSRKSGGLLLNFQSNVGMNTSSNELQQLYQLMKEESTFRGKSYVVMNTGIHNIYAADYKDLILLAKASDVDLVGYYKVDSAMRATNQHLSTFTLEGNRIKYLSQLAHLHEGDVSLDLGVYVMRVGFFKKLISDAITHTNATTFWQALQIFGGQYNFLGQEHNGYAGIIRDLQSYFNVQQDIIKAEVQDDLFYRYHQMSTTSYDEAPTYYHSKADVQSSLLATGCRISGTVKNSIISRRVSLGKNSLIENCIIMNNVEIGDNVRLKNVIIDKETKIADNIELSGTDQIPFVIPVKTQM